MIIGLCKVKLLFIGEEASILGSLSSGIILVLVFSGRIELTRQRPRHWLSCSTGTVPLCRRLSLTKIHQGLRAGLRYRPQV
jgi:hypothetical protein